MSAQPGPRTRLAGGLLLWYAVLGGALAWAIHLMLAWGIDELTCASGSDRIGAVPLRVVVALAVVVPALATVGALLAAALAWRRTAHTRSDGIAEGTLGRTRLLAALGLWANLLFLAIILLGGVALLVFPPCQR
ncbi:hypothetical protein [Micromonospora avicenniae]|uniref:Uncharacterized protein n=1 Tax=Micromonospora avicenniae TaxID=1198245 RepID=A0A1N7BJ31_9ACTN|nr:hypothetical protein [Micromonospora avicenniae]SIR51375.1 hypothetical protein SAMN05444858_11136 [Micromonospora avicenniae]